MPDVSHYTTGMPKFRWEVDSLRSIKPGALANAPLTVDPVRIHHQAREHHQTQDQKHDQTGLFPPDLS